MRSRKERSSIANKISAHNFNRQGYSEVGVEKIERIARLTQQREQSRRPRIRAWRAEDHNPKGKS